MSEYEKPLRRVTVYCGSADGIDPIYLEAAYAMGHVLALSGLELIYGAGKTGLMGAVAQGVLDSGGHVAGIVPHHLNTPRLIHAGLTQLEVVDNMHQRKARMSELADAFIALPGGYGTFEELFETLTWAQLGLHQKPIGLLNTQRYFDPLLELVEHALKAGFIYAEHQVLLVSAGQPGELLDMLRAFRSPDGLERWVDRD